VLALRAAKMKLLRGVVVDERDRAELVLLAIRRDGRELLARGLAGVGGKLANTHDRRHYREPRHRVAHDEQSGEELELTEQGVWRRPQSSEKDGAGPGQPAGPRGDLETGAVLRHERLGRRLRRGAQRDAKLVGKPRRRRARSHEVLIERKQLERLLLD